MLHARATIARELASLFLASGFDVDESVDRGSRLFGRTWRWFRPLARHVCRAFEANVRPGQLVVAQFILDDPIFLAATERHEVRLVDRLAAPPIMLPVSVARTWNLPPIHTAGELAERLQIDLAHLNWFADTTGRLSKQPMARLRHYHFRPLAKRFGQVRMIEAPKARLKQIQRRILSDVLERIPPHQAAHGFRRGRSVVSFAAPHVGRCMVLRIDLENFFPAISRAQVQALFRTVGYPEQVANLLAGLCTTITPADTWDLLADGVTQVRSDRVQRLYAHPHLPQGAPTSPSLANLCAYRLDCRLDALARAAGATYTRYADDLAFSGGEEFSRAANRFHPHASAMVIEEGHNVQHRKTRIMRQGVRQRLAGIVVNEHLNVARPHYDTLKATLTNCIRDGAASQNRARHPNFRAHLAGAISYVEMVNPRRGRRLRSLFERIVW